MNCCFRTIFNTGKPSFAFFLVQSYYVRREFQQPRYFSRSVYRILGFSSIQLHKSPRKISRLIDRIIYIYIYIYIYSFVFCLILSYFLLFSENYDFVYTLTVIIILVVTVVVVAVVVVVVLFCFCFLYAFFPFL